MVHDESKTELVSILNRILRISEDRTEKGGEVVESAIYIASATFPLLLKSSSSTQGKWKHPFNPAREYETYINLSDIKRYVDGKDPLEVWRFLPEDHPSVLRYAAGPISNHSLYDLLFLSLAIYNILKENDVPSFFLFTFGPVQRFISNARKTSDLWSGSYLLSYLTFRAILPILEELGPYHVVFPHLLRQPLVDAWLKEKLKLGDEEESKLNIAPEVLSVANLPNRFLAVVPYKKAKSLAQKVDVNFEEAIKEISQRVLDGIGKITTEKDTTLQTVQGHLTSYFHGYWVVIPWTDENSDPNSPDALELVIEDYTKLLAIGEGGDKLPHAYRTVMALKDREGANVGLAYPLLYDITERFLGARKSVRNFQAIEQGRDRGKCSICGEYDPLPLDWENLRERRPSLVRKGERLCGVCFTKRVLPYIAKDLRYLSDLKGTVRFPSTSDMATVFYKKRLPDPKAIKDTLQNFPLKKAIGNSISPPCLKGHPLYSIDGQWLFRESYRHKYIKNEFGLDLKEKKLEEIWDGVKGHLSESGDPPTYYAILIMDGDSMGKWLSAEHKGIPKFSDLSLGKDLSDIGNYRHPISPVLHGLFSRLLGEFALKKVRPNVEDCICGKLVYAGGDDVLAMLPANKVLEAAYTLRNTFRESVSPKADMSAGVVFVHHKYPLSLALEEVRDAEKKAKKDYERAALYVKFIKRGGEIREFGLKWEGRYPSFKRLITLYRCRELPSKFGYDFLRVITELQINENLQISKNLKDILQNELYRMIKRKIGKVSKEAMEVLKDLLKFYTDVKSDGDGNKNRIHHFANALIVANILAKEDVHD